MVRSSYEICYSYHNGDLYTRIFHVNWFNVKFICNMILTFKYLSFLYCIAVIGINLEPHYERRHIKSTYTLEIIKTTYLCKAINHVSCFGNLRLCILPIKPLELSKTALIQFLQRFSNSLPPYSYLS